MRNYSRGFLLLEVSIALCILLLASTLIASSLHQLNKAEIDVSSRIKALFLERSKGEEKRAKRISIKRVQTHNVQTNSVNYIPSLDSANASDKPHV